MRRKDSSYPGWKQTIGVVLPVLGLLGALLSAPRMARANSGDSFLETIGIGIAVGTVLGASTLPFYDQPGKHLTSAAYGASAGAVAAVGVLVYGLFNKESVQDEYSLNSRASIGNHHLLDAAPVPNALIWTPLVSVTW